MYLLWKFIHKSKEARNVRFGTVAMRVPVHLSAPSIRESIYRKTSESFGKKKLVSLTLIEVKQQSANMTK